MKQDRPSSTKPETDPLRRRNRELSILNTFAEALNRSVDLTQALNSALSHAAELFGLHTGWIWLLNEEDGEPYLAAAQNLPPGLANNPPMMEGSCYCLDTYRAGDLEGAANVNVITCSRLKKLIDGTDGLRYHASVPLYAHGKPLGVLNVASTDWEQLSPEDLRLLYTVSDLLSIAIERARLYARSADFGAAEERNRLAREIHDTLAQGLTAITLQLEAADALMEKEALQPQASAAVKQALLLARSNLEEARRSVLDLRAAPLEGRSLAAALCLLAETIGEKHDLLIKCDMVGGSRPLPARIEAGLFRIAQEALTNIARHANARHATIQLITAPDEVRLMVEDDGKGFDPQQVPEGRFGLVGINERTRLMGGKLELCSEPAQGTRISVIVPFEGRL